MSEARNLFQAIQDNHDDDTPRLIYADWLEENGDPDWAERIRIECELATLRFENVVPKMPALRKRREQLIRKQRKTWKVPKYSKSSLFWERGFLTLEGSPELFAQPAGTQWWDEYKHRIGWVTWCGQKLKPGVCEKLPADLVERTTEIRRTDGTQLRQDEFEEIARYHNLRKLSCPLPMVDAEVACQAWAALGNLTSLDFIANYLFDEDNTRGLASLKNLRKLDFLYGLCGRGLQPLRELVNLEELDVGGLYNVPQQDVLALKSLKKLRKFEVMTYALNGTPDSCRIPNWPELRELKFGMWVNEEQLAELRQYSKLEKLSLTADRARKSELSLLEMPNLPNLRCLHLDRFRLRFSGYEGLKNLPNLRELRLAGSLYLPEELEQLPELPQLETFDWASQVPEQRTAEIIVERFPNVKQLHLDGVYEKELKAVKHLTKLEQVETLVLPRMTSKEWKPVLGFQNVKYLRLLSIEPEQRIGDFVKRFPKLEILDVRWASATKEMLAGIKKHCPNATILK